MEYEEFIAAKSQRTDGLGFEPIWMPHVSDVANGRRPLKADKVDIVCWLTGCNAPRQWLDMQRERIAFEADAYAKEIVFEQFRKVAA